MVVRPWGRHPRLPAIASTLCAALLLAALSGCAGPGWFTSPDDTELPVPPNQTARVYPRAAARTRSASQVQRSSIEPPAESTAATPNTSEKPAAPQTASVETIASAQKEPAAAPATAPAPQKVAEATPTMKRLPPVDPEEEPADKTAVAEAKSAPPAQSAESKSEVKPAAATSEAGQGSVKPAVATSDDKAESTKAAAESKPAYQAGDWLKSRDQALSALEEEIRLGKSDPARATEIAQLETLLRLHYALADRRDDAVRPIEGLREAEQEFWRHEALGLVDLLGSNRLPNESRRFAVALKSLEEAESHLAAAGSLTLRNLTLCRKVQDFGVTEKFPRYDFTPNQEVLLYVEVRNFAAEEKSDHTYETELQGSFRVLDRSGTARAERTLPLDKQTCSNFRRDYYIAYRIYLPTELSPGAYTLELTIEDKKGNKSNNALLDFNIVQ